MNSEWQCVVLSLFIRRMCFWANRARVWKYECSGLFLFVCFGARTNRHKCPSHVCSLHSEPKYPMFCCCCFMLSYFILVFFSLPSLFTSNVVLLWFTFMSQCRVYNFWYVCETRRIIEPTVEKSKSIFSLTSYHRELEREKENLRSYSKISSQGDETELSMLLDVLILISRSNTTNWRHHQRVILIKIISSIDWFISIQSE